MRKKLKGFSLIELLVTMAIIAILLGLVGFGIATAQRNSRDSQRRQKVSDIRLGLEDFLTRKNRYPSPSEFSTDGEKVIIEAGDTDIEIEVKGPTVPGQKTDNTSTRYCYDNTGNGGYLLGAKLENGEWFDESSTIDSADKCSDTSPQLF